MADPVFHSGRFGKVFVGSTPREHFITRWTVNNAAAQVDFRNSGTGRFDDTETTFLGATGEIYIDRDFANNPFQGPSGIVAGVLLKNLVLQENEDEDNAYTFPLATVVGVPHELVIDGKVTIVAQFRNKRAYTYPGNVDPVAAIDASEA